MSGAGRRTSACIEATPETYRQTSMKPLKVTLDYGRTGLTVELPAERVVGPLAIRDVPPLDDPEGAVAAALETPDRLADRSARSPGADKDACILVCDITRPVPNPTILGPDAPRSCTTRESPASRS